MKELGYVKGLDGEYHPRMVTLGGDHTIVSHLSGCFRSVRSTEHVSFQVLPILQSLHEVYGPVSVIHFDAHIDT